jgi:L-malate glycosyltransferase
VLLREEGALSQVPARKILVIPSWYPRPDDRINGSFFQEQARLVSALFDVKVLIVRFAARPSIRTFFRKPVATSQDWLRFYCQKTVRTRLPDEEVFLNPPLVEYGMRVLGLTQRQRYERRLNAYMAALDELIAAGWKPDLVHAHSVSLAGLVAQRIKDVYGIPYVITEHMPFALTNYPEYMRGDIKQAFERAAVVLSLSYDKIRQLGMSGIDVEPNVIFNYVDEKRFDKVCPPYHPGEALQLITIGAASHLKDHRTLLRALTVLKRRKVPFSMTLIGLRVWGELYEDTLDFIRRNDLEGDVTVIDRIERDRVAEYLKRHNIFLMTSIAEGFPISVLEAMACGLFVVATRHGGTEDILIPETGALVEVKNFQKIADVLSDVYSGAIRFEPRAIREYVVSLCGSAAFAERLSGYYDQAMHGN